MVEGSIAFDPEMELENSFLGILGSAVSVIFVPLGFGSIRAARRHGDGIGGEGRSGRGLRSARF